MDGVSAEPATPVPLFRDRRDIPASIGWYLTWKHSPEIQQRINKDVANLILDCMFIREYYPECYNCHRPRLYETPSEDFQPATKSGACNPGRCDFIKDIAQRAREVEKSNNVGIIRMLIEAYRHSLGPGHDGSALDNLERDVLRRENNE